MALPNLQLVRDPNGLPGEFIWLDFREGDHTCLVSISRADLTAVIGEPQPRAEQDAVVEESLDALKPIIEAKLRTAVERSATVAAG